jgi:hypothetical protein
MHAVARAVDEDRIRHAYRRRNQLILSDEVDVNTQIEVTTAGQKMVKPPVVRATNRKSIEELTKVSVPVSGRTGCGTRLSSCSSSCEHPAAATQARLAHRDIQPHLVQTVRRHSGPKPETVDG